MAALIAPRSAGRSLSSQPDASRSPPGGARIGSSVILPQSASTDVPYYYGSVGGSNLYGSGGIQQVVNVAPAVPPTPRLMDEKTLNTVFWNWVVLLQQDIPARWFKNRDLEPIRVRTNNPLVDQTFLQNGTRWTIYKALQVFVSSVVVDARTQQDKYNVLTLVRALQTNPTTSWQNLDFLNQLRKILFSVNMDVDFERRSLGVTWDSAALQRSIQFGTFEPWLNSLLEFQALFARLQDMTVQLYGMVNQQIQTVQFNAGVPVQSVVSPQTIPAAPIVPFINVPSLPTDRKLVVLAPPSSATRIINPVLAPSSSGVLSSAIVGNSVLLAPPASARRLASTPDVPIPPTEIITSLPAPIYTVPSNIEIYKAPPSTLVQGFESIAATRATPVPIVAPKSATTASTVQTVTSSGYSPPAEQERTGAASPQKVTEPKTESAAVATSTTSPAKAVESHIHNAELEERFQALALANILQRSINEKDYENEDERKEMVSQMQEEIKRAGDLPDDIVRAASITGGLTYELMMLEKSFEEGKYRGTPDEYTKRVEELQAEIDKLKHQLFPHKPAKLAETSEKKFTADDLANWKKKLSDISDNKPAELDDDVWLLRRDSQLNDIRAALDKTLDEGKFTGTFADYQDCRAAIYDEATRIFYKFAPERMNRPLTVERGGIGELIAAKLAASKEGKGQTHATSTEGESPHGKTAQETASTIELVPGMAVSALYVEDGKYYPAVIEQLLDNGKVLVTYTDGNTQSELERDQVIVESTGIPASAQPRQPAVTSSTVATTPTSTTPVTGSSSQAATGSPIQTSTTPIVPITTQPTPTVTGGGVTEIKIGDITLAPGTKVMAMYNDGNYYPATVQKISENKVTVEYTGYNESADLDPTEVKPEDYIQTASSAGGSTTGQTETKGEEKGQGSSEPTGEATGGRPPSPPPISEGLFGSGSAAGTTGATSASAPGGTGEAAGGRPPSPPPISEGLFGSGSTGGTTGATSASAPGGTGGAKPAKSSPAKSVGAAQGSATTSSPASTGGGAAPQDLLAQIRAGRELKSSKSGSAPANTPATTGSSTSAILSALQGQLALRNKQLQADEPEPESEEDW